MMFTHIDVNFGVKYEGHQNWSKILSGDFFFFVSLLHSSGVSFFCIGHLFDNLTPFNMFITCICSMGKGNNFTSLSVCSHGGTKCSRGYLSQLGGYLPCPGRYLTECTGCTYLCLEYLPWQGDYLHLQGATYLGWEGTLTWGGSYLFWGGYIPWSGGCTFLGNLRKYFSLGGCDSPEKIFLFGRVCWSC